MLLRREKRRAYYQKHKIDQCKKLLNEYSFNAIQRIKESYYVDIEAMVEQYSYKHVFIKYFGKNLDYVLAYIRKVMKIYLIAALTVCNDVQNICKLNNFKSINFDNYEV